MAKHKHGKHKAAEHETAAQGSETPVAESVAAGAETAAEKVAAVAETAAEQVSVQSETVAQSVNAGAQAAAETVATQAAQAEKAANEAAGQVSSFVKGRLEQAQRQFEQLEAELQKRLQPLVIQGRESGLKVLLKLNDSVHELRRENPTVQKLEQQALQVGGVLRQRLDTLQHRMVKVVGTVASQSQVDAINRELDRLGRKLDALVGAPQKPEQPRQETPKA
jgi:exonuclease VII large subunit